MADGFPSLRRRRARVESTLEAYGLLHTLSAARFQLHAEVARAIGAYASGHVLEAGAGRSPYRSALDRSSTSVTTLDIAAERNPDIVGDVQDMKAIADATFDTVLSTQVLEHVRDPRSAMGEFGRVLRPCGVLILSAPHLSMIHEAPNDFFRFTSFGFEALCDSSGLDVVEIRPVGGPLSFLGHVISLGWLSGVGVLPGLFWPAWAINYALMVRGLGFLDEMLVANDLLPRDYVLIARRPELLSGNPME